MEKILTFELYFKTFIRNLDQLWIMMCKGDYPFTPITIVKSLINLINISMYIIFKALLKKNCSGFNSLEDIIDTHQFSVYPSKVRV